MSVPPDNVLSQDPPMVPATSGGTSVPYPDLRVSQEREKQLMGQRDSFTQGALKARSEAADETGRQAADFEKDIGQVGQMQQQTPMNHMQAAMRQVPWLMALTAIGGKATKANGMAMMQAMNGIMQGVTSGTEQQYNDSMKAYQQHYKELMDRIELKQRLFEMRSKAYQGRVDAQELAARDVDRMIGDERADQSNAVRAWYQMQSLGQKAPLITAQIDNLHSEVQRRKDLTTQGQQKINNVLAKTAAKAKNKDEAIQQIDDVLTMLDNAEDENQWVTGIKGMAARTWESIATNMLGSSDTTAHRFSSQMNALIVSLPTIMTQDGRYSKAKIDQIQKVVDGLKTGSSVPIVRDELKIVRNILNEVSQSAPQDGATSASFATESEAEAAEKAGTLKKGTRVTIGGVSGTWK